MVTPIEKASLELSAAEVMLKASGVKMPYEHPQVVILTPEQEKALRRYCDALRSLVDAAHSMAYDADWYFGYCIMKGR